MRQLQVPAVIDTAMRHGATMIISVSGGKDSQAVLNAVTGEYLRRGWTGPIAAVHADLGRIEWVGVSEHVAKMVEAAGLILNVVTAGDMVDRWKRRMVTLEGTGKPFWSSAAHRYCTSDMKRNPIDKFLRKFKGIVISVDGVRAEESPARAKKPSLSIRKQITTKGMDVSLDHLATRLDVVERWASHGVMFDNRAAWNWSAIHEWTLADVWDACGTSEAEIATRRNLYSIGRTLEALNGISVHHAYVRGNQRLSCAMCVLASDSDIRNGAMHHPEVAAELVEMERVSGFTFKNKKSLASIIETVMKETN